ncbi:Rop family plasmid primer RNA-binding protein [Citrobacter freundii]|uniref:Rop family plasmid primer RNA-binding protein n=1 Tax=Citrobacter freundii TaxID=546 RepID=UPI001CD240CC|nr:Rop family plasmid primer RNA-binding protein [Citrobacter freundii]
MAQGTESLGCHFALSRNRPHLDDEAADCERMHEQAEALYQKLSARFGIQDGE